MSSQLLFETSTLVPELSKVVTTAKVAAGGQPRQPMLNHRFNSPGSAGAQVVADGDPVDHRREMSQFKVVRLEAVVPILVREQTGPVFRRQLPPTLPLRTPDRSEHALKQSDVRKHFNGMLKDPFDLGSHVAEGGSPLGVVGAESTGPRTAGAALLGSWVPLSFCGASHPSLSRCCSRHVRTFAAPEGKTPAGHAGAKRAPTRRGSAAASPVVQRCRTSKRISTFSPRTGASGVASRRNPQQFPAGAGARDTRRHRGEPTHRSEATVR